MLTSFAMHFVILLTLFEVISAAIVFRHRPLENPYLQGGDIVRRNSSLYRNAVFSDSEKWPGGIIPYVLNDDIGDQSELIMTAMEHISSKTCIQFVPRTEEDDFVHITYGEGWAGCHSSWGRSGGSQDLTLGPGCHNFGTVVHELMHAMGFEHEHNRSDRDDYIQILWQNIDEMYYPAFEKLKPDESRILTEFDYESIMMYGSKAFAKHEGLHSIEARREGTHLKEVSEKDGLSEGDVQMVNILYEC